MKTDEINNSQDIIDSRNIIERIDELEDLITNNNDLPEKEREDLTSEETELKALTDLAEQASTSPDWKYGEALIRESYFVEYVEGMLKDIGELPQDIPWYISIDWDTTAENIRADYIAVDFDEVEYLIRG